MNKFKVFIIFQTLFLLTISYSYSKTTSPFCDNKIGTSINASEIDYLEIKIHKSKKWVENLMNAYLVPNTFINERFKKRYNSKLIVFYKSGAKCEFNIKTRLNGDMRDHIQIIDNQIVSSMNINISGHLQNSTQIKLLLPKTRKEIMKFLSRRS